MMTADAKFVLTRNRVLADDARVSRARPDGGQQIGSHQDGEEGDSQADDDRLRQKCEC